MSILNQLKGTGSKSKWTQEEEVAFLEGMFGGMSGDELAKHVGRPKTGFYAKRAQLEKKFAAAGITEANLEDCIAAITTEVAAA